MGTKQALYRDMTHLQDGKAHNKCSMLAFEPVECTSNDPEHQGIHEKANKLNRFAPDVLDGNDGEPVPREVSCCGNDEVADSVVVQIIPDSIVRVEADGRQDDTLVEIDAVEGLSRPIV